MKQILFDEIKGDEQEDVLVDWCIHGKMSIILMVHSKYVMKKSSISYFCW